MNKQSFILFMLFLINCQCVWAQEKEREKKHHPWKHILGTEIRIDKESLIEGTYKFINKGARSFGIKYGRYNYEKRILPLDIQSSISTKGTHSYNIEGNYLKAGWLFYSKVAPYGFMSHGVYLVTSRSNLAYSRNISNGWSSVSIAPQETYYAFGLEYEFVIGVILVDNFLLTIAGETGYKPMNVNPFEDVLKGVDAFSKYTPGQGYGTLPVYINLSLGIGFIF
ncbi:MAG: hypothetical protein V4590_01015 [Bacteroidota bacterium]